jgi:hypothetical protein
MTLLGDKALRTTPKYSVMICPGVMITLEEIELHAVGCVRSIVLFCYLLIETSQTRYVYSSLE